jgi:hypothetical protein
MVKGELAKPLAATAMAMVFVAVAGASAARAEMIATGDSTFHIPIVRLRIDDQGRVLTGGVKWNAGCKGAPVRFRTATAIAPQGKEASGRIRIRGAYRFRQQGYRIKVNVRLQGREVPFGADGVPTTVTWRGRFAASASVRRHGRHFATCRTRKGLKWKVRARVPDASEHGSAHFVVEGRPGDELTGGHRTDITAPPYEINAGGSHGALTASLRGPNFGVDENWGFSVGAGVGNTLRPGAYYEVDGEGYPGPDIHVDGNGRGCGSTGRFYVSSITFDHYNRLAGYDVSFEQLCENAQVPITGRIVFTANPPGTDG